jgi:hypothetical protein
MASCGHGNEIHKESGGGGARVLLNVRIEEFELAFDGFEWEAAEEGWAPFAWKHNALRHVMRRQSRQCWRVTKSASAKWKFQI